MAAKIESPVSDTPMLPDINAAAFAAALRAALAPDPELLRLEKEDLIRRQRREDEEERLKAERAARLKAQGAQLVKQEQKKKVEQEWREASCPHLKSGTQVPSVGGQVLSDGSVVITCLRCQKVWTAATRTHALVDTKGLAFPHELVGIQIGNANI
jgi:hypothetical protein